MMAVCNVLSWVALVSGFKKLGITLYSSLLSSFVYVIHIQAENEHLKSQVPLPLLLSETVMRFLLSLSDIRIWTGWKMLAVTARTAHPILSAGAPLVAPNERWYHTGPLSSGVIAFIDLVTDQPPACWSLFCLPAVLAWCNWQSIDLAITAARETAEVRGLGGEGGGSGRGTHMCVPCRNNMKMILHWQGTALAFTRRLNQAAITRPPSTGYPGNIGKSPGFTGNMSKLIPVSPHLNYLFISVSSDLLVHLGIDSGLEYAVPSWKEGQCEPTKRSIRQESIVRPLIAWCLRTQLVLPESLSVCLAAQYSDAAKSKQTASPRIAVTSEMQGKLVTSSGKRLL